MQNAHERFGILVFTKHTKDTTTRVRVHVARAVLEPAEDGRGPTGAHLLSMIEGDAEIGALSAAVTEGALFQIHFPGHGAIDGRREGMPVQDRRNLLAHRGITLPKRVLGRLNEIGVFAQPHVSLEHQHLARRYVIRGIESGGAVKEIGRYVTFCGSAGEPLIFSIPSTASP